MKNRKIMGSRIKGKNERGAWAEMYFMVLAMTYGLKVSSPYGGYGPYDVGVEGEGPILRVQVKCTLCKDSKGGYGINVNRSYGQKHRRGYAPGTVDFFALYIIPTDDWYIIPYEVIGEKSRNLHFRPEFRRQKYDKYKEAWRLLVDAANRPSGNGIEIQACCADEEELALARRGAGGRISRALLFLLRFLLCLCAFAVRTCLRSTPRWPPRLWIGGEVAVEEGDGFDGQAATGFGGLEGVDVVDFDE
jgi:hypothetical protein